jgi:hypothetical protein
MTWRSTLLAMSSTRNMNIHLLSDIASYDVASNLRSALVEGVGAAAARAAHVVAVRVVVQVIHRQGEPAVGRGGGGGRCVRTGCRAPPPRAPGQRARTWSAGIRASIFGASVSGRRGRCGGPSVVRAIVGRWRRRRWRRWRGRCGDASVVRTSGVGVYGSSPRVRQCRRAAGHRREEHRRHRRVRRRRRRRRRRLRCRRRRRQTLGGIGRSLGGSA